MKEKVWFNSTYWSNSTCWYVLMETMYWGEKSTKEKKSRWSNTTYWYVLKKNTYPKKKSGWSNNTYPIIHIDMYWTKTCINGKVYDSIVHIDTTIHINIYSRKICTEEKKSTKEKRVDDPTIHVDMYWKKICIKGKCWWFNMFWMKICTKKEKQLGYCRIVQNLPIFFIRT